MPKRRLTLRRWLTLLVLGTAVPLLLFAAVTLAWLIREYRTDQDRRQSDTARALALAADAQIRAWKAALGALANSQNLAEGRLGEFYREAHALADQHHGWIVLTDRSGRQRLNTLRPFGDPLPLTSSPRTIDAVVRDGKPVVTDLVFGKVAQRYLVAVAVPVLRDGEVVDVLDMSFAPEQLDRLLVSQRPSASSGIAITDGQQQVVARVPPRPEREGQPVVPTLARAFQNAMAGTIDVTLTTGQAGRVAFQRMTEAPWTVSVIVPVAEIRAAWQRPVLGFLLLGALAVLAALLCALSLSRRIASPVGEAAHVAAGIMQGGPPTFPASPVAEVADLQRALLDGATAVRQALQKHEDAAAALERANTELEARVSKRTEALTQALADKDALLREVHHRVKNNLQMLCDMLYLQMEAIAEPDKAAILRDTYTRIYAIARLHEQLYRSLQSGHVILREYLGSLVAGFDSVYPQTTIRLDVPSDPIYLDVDRAIHAGLIANELVTNAAKHAFPHGEPGEVLVRLRALEGDRLELRVADSGKGLPPGLDLANTKTLGLRIVHILARRLDAALEIENHKGTAFTIRFPAHGEEPVEARAE